MKETKVDTKVLNDITSCQNCYFRNDCWKHHVCGSFKPIDTDKYCEQVTKYLHNNIKPTGETKLTRHVFQMANWGTYTDCKTLDQFYCDMINDNLREIRKGYTCYCFHIDQIIDMYKLEPKLRVKTYDEGIYYITL